MSYKNTNTAISCICIFAVQCGLVIFCLWDLYEMANANQITANNVTATIIWYAIALFLTFIAVLPFKFLVKLDDKIVDEF